MKNTRITKFSPNILAVLIIVFFIYKIWDNLLSFFKSKPFKVFNTIGSTIDEQKARQISESLYLAMNNYGTDEDVIFLHLKDISRPNFNMVYNAFDKRYYDQQLGINGAILLDQELDLLGWLESELNEAELSRLKQIAPNVFS